MSHHSSSSYTYSSTSYSSSTSSASNGAPQTYTKSQTTRSSYDDASGGRAERVTQETGQPTLVERTDIPARTGIEGASGSGSGSGPGQARIEDVTDKENEKESEADQRYREAMEDEYAKREGGA